MGFIGAIYILDHTQFPILHYKLNPNVPSFDYIRNQLLISKRELLSKSGIDFSNFDSSQSLIFDSSIPSINSNDLNDFNESNDDINNYVLLDPIIKLDSDWLVSWCKADSLYLLTIGSLPQKIIDVVSEDEDEDEDGDEEIDKDEEEASDLFDVINQQKVLNNSQLKNREEYSEFVDDNTESVQSNDIEEGKSETPESKNSSIIDKNKKPQSISNFPNPLQYINFLDVFIQAIKLILRTNTLSSHKIQLNSHRIIMLLQELLDASVPFISDMNQLRELLPNDSIIDKLVLATKQIQNTAASSISNIKNASIPNIRNDKSLSNFTYSTILEKSGNKTPWRKANIKTAQNEIFIDLYETIDLIISPRKIKNVKTFSRVSNFNSSSYLDKNVSIIKAVVHGHLNLTTSLIGHPILEIQLNVPSSIELKNCYPSLHRSINKNIWRNSNGNLIQLIPPDEKCKLLTYNIDLLELKEEIFENSNEKLDISKFCGLIGVELHSGLGINKNEFEIILNTGCGLNAGFGSKDSNNLKEIEDLCIEIFLPGNASLNINSNKSNLNKKNESKSTRSTLMNMNNNSNKYGEISDNNTGNSNLDMKVLSSSTGTVIKTEKGTYQWKLDSDIVVGGIFTLRGSIGNLERNNEDESIIDKKKRLLRNEISPRFIQVHYKHYGTVPSGIKVQNISLVSDLTKAKPFKGVKYTTKSGEYIVR
jgi:hypothetical protein